MRLLYEQAAREQRELAERVRAPYGSGTLAADFERWAADLERLARPDPRTTRGLTLRGGFGLTTLALDYTQRVVSHFRR
jgi:hypothetical protein